MLNKKKRKDMVLGNKLKTLRGFNNLQERIQNNQWPNYDFTNSIYVNNSTKLVLSCWFHGECLIRPNYLDLFINIYL